MAALACAVWAAWKGGEWYLAAVVLATVALLHVLTDRERFWCVRCERCRWKKRTEVRETKPKMGTTIIDWF